MRQSDQSKAGMRKTASVHSWLVFCALFLCGARAAEAQSATWTGSQSNQWSNASNWNLPLFDNSPPNSSTFAVTINNATNNPVMLNNSSTTVGTLSLGSGNSLDMSNVDFYVAGGSISNAGQINLGGPSAVSLFVESNLTLSGSGTLTLNNAGTGIGANGYGGTSTTFTNQSTIAGQGSIGDVNFANQGTVNANVAGGTLQLQFATATNTGTLQATGGSTLSILDTSVNNSNGTIFTDGTSRLLISGSSITGGNVTNLGNIAGQGQIYNVNLTNQGTVNANVSGATLYLESAPAANTGTFQASGGGMLEIDNTSVNNRNGTISTDGSSSVIINSSSITGGNLTTTGGGVIHGQYATIGGVTITNGSTYSVDPGYSNSLSSGITNNGSLLIGGSTGAAYLYVQNPLTIAGNGTVTLNNAGSYLFGTSLTSQSTIAGQGAIYNNLNNQGTVNANVSGGTLSLQNAAVTNSGTLQALFGGTLGIYNTTVNNAGGNIFTDATSSLIIKNSSITASTFTNEGTLTGYGSIALAAPATPNEGNFLNQGTVNANVNGQALTLDVLANNAQYSTGANRGTLEATGGGTLVLVNPQLLNAGGTISTDRSSSLIMALNGAGFIEPCLLKGDQG